MSNYSMLTLRPEAVDRLDALFQQFNDNQANHNARLTRRLVATQLRTRTTSSSDETDGRSAGPVPT